MGRPKVRTDEVRVATLAAAVATLERDGPGALSARRVAATAGTSTGALYEFFGDKAGLVRAVAAEGFAGLLDALRGVPDQDDARRHLVALLDAVRRFAHARPTLFEVMTARPIAEYDPSNQELQVATAVYRVLVDAVARWLGTAGSATSPREAAHIVVAAHGGFVAAELAGIAGSSRRTIDARYRRGVDAVLDGLT